MQIRLASDITPESVVDGDGIRTVVWTQGCKHNCPKCHNPSTHSFDGGFLKDVDELCQEILDVPFQDGITLSGGDPLEQIDACLYIAKFCQEHGLNVWCYTGYRMEYLLERIKKEENLKELLLNIDALVDSPFMIDLLSYNTPFRGSKNQRIINTRESINKNMVCEISKYIVK